MSSQAGFADPEEIWGDEGSGPSPGFAWGGGVALAAAVVVALAATVWLIAAGGVGAWYQWLVMAAAIGLWLLGLGLALYYLAKQRAGAGATRVGRQLKTEPTYAAPPAGAGPSPFEPAPWEADAPWW